MPNLKNHIDYYLVVVCAGFTVLIVCFLLIAVAGAAGLVTVGCAGVTVAAVVEGFFSVVAGFFTVSCLSVAGVVGFFGVTCALLNPAKRMIAPSVIANFFICFYFLDE